MVSPHLAYEEELVTCRLGIQTPLAICPPSIPFLLVVTKAYGLKGRSTSHLTHFLPFPPQGLSPSPLASMAVNSSLFQGRGMANTSLTQGMGWTCCFPTLS